MRFLLSVILVSIFLSTGANAAVQWVKYLVGSGVDRAQGVAQDKTGAVWSVGMTASTDFPVKNAQQSKSGGGASDAFVAKLDPKGEVVWATYLGGSAADEANRAEVDAQGNVYVIG